MNDTHFHIRNLPHFYRPNSTYFITYRLKGSIPIKVLKELKEMEEFKKDYKSKAEKYLRDKKFFAEYDNLLDNNLKIQHLKNYKIAEIVKTTLHYPDKKYYNLICYTIMPNHVHLVFHLLENIGINNSQSGLTVLQKSNDVAQTIMSERLSKIMKSIKGISAREANKLLNSKGSFWQSESYDHIVRDEDELERIIKYVLYNPVKANLVEKWEDWEFTYLAE
jgi:REP element-mobilizing transposase RayT